VFDPQSDHVCNIPDNEYSMWILNILRIGVCARLTVCCCGHVTIPPFLLCHISNKYEFHVAAG